MSHKHFFSDLCTLTVVSECFITARQKFIFPIIFCKAGSDKV